MQKLLPLLVCSVLLAACDQLGIESATVIAEKRGAEGKAIGGACRHAGRAIEDCYTLNKKAEKASIYAGWREMDDYMRENKLEPVLPVIKPEDLKPKPKPAADEDTADPGAGEAGKERASGGKSGSVGAGKRPSSH
jgi:hypothetical protein